MLNKIPCVYKFINNTKEGDRNTNFFKALSHIKNINPTVTYDELLNEALQINKEFKDSLSENEVKNVVKHVDDHNYKSSCNMFKQYCERCDYGYFKKSYNQKHKNYWKTLTRDNKIKGINSLPEDIELYPWDIVDTSLIEDKDAVLRIKLMRESKGINPDIDEVLKSRGIKIDEEALREWLKKRG